MITDLLAGLAGLPFPLLLLVAGVASAVESGLGVGMVFPGEAGVLILATTATGAFRFAALVLIVAVAASAGDHVGYLLGRRHGPRLRETRLVRKLGVSKWDRAMESLHRHGAAAVVLTRMVPVVRTFAPAGAGVAGLVYRRFLVASLAAGLLWAGAYVGLGALAGASVRYLESMLGTAGWILFAALALAGGAVWLRRRVRASRAVRAPAMTPEPLPADEVGWPGSRAAATTMALTTHAAKQRVLVPETALAIPRRRVCNPLAGDARRLVALASGWCRSPGRSCPAAWRPDR